MSDAARKSETEYPQVRCIGPETGVFWFAGDDRVELVIDTDQQRIVWIGKFDGKHVKGGDVPLPSGLTEMLSKIGIVAS